LCLHYFAFKFHLLFYQHTVKLGCNELGYNEHSLITNKNIHQVGLGHFYDKISRL
jgi:hypothetical protein